MQGVRGGLKAWEGILGQEAADTRIVEARAQEDQTGDTVMFAGKDETIEGLRGLQ